MADFFLDSSAVFKRYVQETGTAWIRALAAIIRVEFPEGSTYKSIATDIDGELVSSTERK